MQSMWWFVAALLLGAAEVVTLDLTLLMCAGGALAGGAASMMGLNPWLAAVVAIVTALLLLFTLRPFLLRAMRDRTPLVETNAAALVGKNAKALTDVSEEKGRVKLMGEVWTARAESGSGPIAEGTEVVVVKIAGATAIVKPA